MNPQLWWFVTRSTGIITWALATASVLWGLAVTSKPLGKKPSPAWMLDLHRFLGALTVLFLAGHVGALVADNYTNWTAADLAVPYATAWKPGAVAWGIVAAWLLVAVEVSSLFLRHLPRVWWRRLHLAGYVVFAASTAHFLTAGTDRENLALRAAVGASVGAVAFLTVFRVRQARRKRAGKQATPVAAGVTAPARATAATRGGRPLPRDVRPA